MPLPAPDGVGATILAYFSHSYRVEDREVNSFFWELFYDEGFFFTVDPQSEFLSIPYLESMMMLSNCFVAVIPRRAGAKLGCSSYILFEYGLAVQAQKPLLVFVEQGLSGASFPRDAERIIPFNRNRLAASRGDFVEAIHRLGDKVRGYRNPDVRLSQPCGLVLRSGADVEQIYTPALVERLQEEVRKLGRELELVTLDFGASFEFSLELDKYDFLILEVRDSLQVPWLAGYILGRAVPSVKVCYVAPGEAPADVPMPSIVARHKPEHTDEPAVSYWRDEAELLQQMTRHVSKFNTERIEFTTKEKGLRYFSQAGRRREKVFVSNASASQELAYKLITRLKLESIDFFHYQVKDAIPVGDRWLPALESEVGKAGILVALITEAFLRSPWCLYELQAALRCEAEGSLRILSYVLDPAMEKQLTSLGVGPIQARTLQGSDEYVVSQIVDDLDAELKKDTSRVRPAAAPPLTAPASLVLSEDERRSLVDVLAARLTTEDGVARPRWVKGLLMTARLYAPLAGEDYSGSATAVATVLVTKAESLGVITDGDLAVCRLIRALVDGNLVAADATPFLTRLAERLSRPSAT